MLLGQADGIACRTMEMFEAFGFSERVLKEACWINETTFWKPDDKQPANIVRSGWVQDVEDGLSEFPHVVLNQARVHDFYLDVMRKSAAKLEPHYARRAPRPSRPATGGRRRCRPIAVTVTLERLDPAHEGEIETIKARYVVGCDGARSTVRKSIGRELARRFRQSRLGRHGCAGRHRLPRHSLQVADPVRQRRQHPHHPAGRRLSRSASISSSTSSTSANGSQAATSRSTI